MIYKFSYSWGYFLSDRLGSTKCEVLEGSKGRGFSDSSVGKEPACNAGDLGLIPGLGRSPEGRERLPTPVFWPGEFHGHKELDTTE